MLGSGAMNGTGSPIAIGEKVSRQSTDTCAPELEISQIEK